MTTTALSPIAPAFAHPTCQTDMPAPRVTFPCPTWCMYRDNPKGHELDWGTDLPSGRTVRVHSRPGFGEGVYADGEEFLDSPGVVLLRMYEPDVVGDAMSTTAARKMAAALVAAADWIDAQTVHTSADPAGQIEQVHE